MHENGEGALSTRKLLLDERGGAAGNLIESSTGSAPIGEEKKPLSMGKKARARKIEKAHVERSSLAQIKTRMSVGRNDSCKLPI